MSAVLVGMLTTNVDEKVMGPVKNAICGTFGAGCEQDDDKPTYNNIAHGNGQQGGPQNLAATPGGENGGEGLDHDRRDTERDARDSRRRDRGDEDGQPPPTEQPQQPTSPLGEPVPGEKVQVPEPPPWAPVDPGAGRHGSEDAGFGGHWTKFLAESGANALSGSWPNASRNLLHFLGNSGEPLEQDVNQMMSDVPEFKQAVDQHQKDIAAQAVEEAKRRGATGPITFPVNTAWTGFGYNEGGVAYENKDWFYALGGWQYNINGQVTVYPPSEPGGKWRYEMKTNVNVKDRYNWDGGKSTQIGPFTVTDEELAALHRQGLAQEYTAWGRSREFTTEGEI